MKNNAIIVNLHNFAMSTPVPTTTVVVRDLFFGEWMDEVNIGVDSTGVEVGVEVGIQSNKRIQG